MPDFDDPNDDAGRGRAMLEALDQQLHSPDSKDVKVQYDRLIAAGVEDAAAREMMAAVLEYYVTCVLSQQKYTYQDYLTDLKTLPGSADEWLGE